MLLKRAMQSFQTNHIHQTISKIRPCYCNGQPLHERLPEPAFPRDKIKLTDLADISIIEAPSLSKLATFDTRFLGVDRNTPITRAINARMN